MFGNLSDTEIDWNAYMQEVEGFLNGTLDYELLKGETGPLVYPAGFVYVFSALYYVTDYGKNIARAQWIYGALYLVLMYQVFRLYCRSRKVRIYYLNFHLVRSASQEFLNYSDIWVHCVRRYHHMPCYF